MTELHSYVEVQLQIAPASPDRVLRALRQEGDIDYVVVDRRASYYLLLPIPKKGSKQVTFNLGERIKQIRAIEAKIEKETTEFDLRMKPYEDFATAARAEVLQFLLKSRQKSTNTEFGGAYWKPKITYSVEDKVAFQRHIIGTEQWDLTTWAATPSISEAFTHEHEGVPPPGLKRSEVINVYITPPVKPRVKKAPAAPATAEPQVESLT
jgi:hypothetical protein